jgi:hypothetical protein
MNAIKKLWTSILNLAGALDRLTGLAHAAGDALEERLPAVQASAPPAIEGAAEPGKNGRRLKTVAR